MSTRRAALRSLVALLGGALVAPVWALGRESADADAGGGALAARLATADNWRRWGSGDYRWFGVRVYSATLWVAGRDPASAPHSLELVYHRDIPSHRLVTTSLDLMARAGADAAVLARARASLQRLLPDVRAGESLRAIHAPGLGLRVHHDANFRGDVEDAEFARHFMAIWLGEDSVAPELRAALLTPPR